MPYSYREDISIADAAIEVTANSLEELFIDSAKALTNTMIDNLDSIKCNNNFLSTYFSVFCHRKIHLKQT